MYKTVLFFYCCCFAFTSTAQNLLLNGDFEEFWECPDNLGQLNRCKHSFDPCKKTTADYLNECMHSNNFDYSFYGKSYRGNGMCAIVLGEWKDDFTPTGWREYVQLKLIRQLKKNDDVFFSFYVRYGYWSNLYVSTSEIGVVFREDSILFENPLWEYMQADWRNTSVNFDTVTEWTKLSGKYTPNGGEQWLVIGNFFNSLNIPKTIYDSLSFSNTNHSMAYLYLDYVWVGKNIILPNVFTPNNDGNNDLWILDFVMDEDDFRIENISIFNRWGKIVFKAGNEFSGWDGNCNGEPCSEGVYFVVVLVKNTQNNSIDKYTGNITLLR